MRCTWIDFKFTNVLDPPGWAHESNEPSPQPYCCMTHYPAYLAWIRRSSAAKRVVATKRAKYTRWPANYKKEYDYVC